MPAKPSRKLLPSSPLCETSSMPESSTRKRKRQAEDDEFDPSKQIYDENGKTRRINPFKLATRLHPDLVKEMDAYIKPGAIMPNFEIRKELQIRYQVDRRHLYDYFHSRGLRVAKEDRHSNLTRSRLAKAKTMAPADGAKKNAPPKLKPTKSAPAKRSTTKSEKMNVKKPATEKPVVDNGVPLGSSKRFEEHDSELDGEYDTDLDYDSHGRSAHQSATSSMNIDAAVFDTYTVAVEKQLENVSHSSLQIPRYSLHRANYVPTTVEAAITTKSLSFLANPVISGRSTPALTDDSCSPSPAPMKPEEDEEPFCPSEFLNLPEEPEAQTYSFMDSVLDLSSAPSMIGDLMSSSDRKNMYNHIDTSIVSNGSSFALDLSSVNKPYLDTLCPATSSSSFDSNYGAVVQGSTSMPVTHQQQQQHHYLPSSSMSSGSFCVPPSALSRVPRQFTPGDFLTPHSGPIPRPELNYDYSNGRRIYMPMTAAVPVPTPVAHSGQSSVHASAYPGSYPHMNSGYPNYGVPASASESHTRPRSISLGGRRGGFY